MALMFSIIAGTLRDTSLKRFPFRWESESAPASSEVSSISESSWQLGYKLLKFGLRPGAGGEGSQVSLRAERDCEFGDVVPVRGIDNDKEIVVAGSEIDLLDFNAYFLGELPSRLSPLGSVLDRTDSLVSPVERQYEHRHAVLHVFTHSFCSPL